MTEAMQAQAQAYAASEPAIDGWASSRLARAPAAWAQPRDVIISRMEGGANVVSEALALGVPVIASRIDGM